MRPNKFILVDREPVPIDDLESWGIWFEGSMEERIVGRTDLSDGFLVSTVFLGLDHNFSGKGPPILFETMVFIHGREEACVRTCTWTEAEHAHETMCRRVKQLQAIRAARKLN